jgi:hypothetical protein
MIKSLQLHFNIYTRWQVQLHQSIDRLRGRLVNIDNATVSAGLEVLAGVFIDVGRSQQTIDAAARGEWDGSDRCGVGAISGIDDLFAGGVEDALIEGFKTNANFLLLDSCHWIIA